MVQNGLGQAPRRGRIWRMAVAAVFVLILVMGLLLYDDYGISVDEPTERWSAQYNYDLIKHLLIGSNSAERDPAEDAVMLDVFKMRYYGAALQLPPVLFTDAVRLITGTPLPQRSQYLMLHLYTFLLFYGALIVFYRFLRRLAASRVQALTGVAMLLLCPRIFAHAFFNIKDIPFLCCMVFLFSATERMLSSGKRWSWCLLVALLGAVTVSVRTIGALWLVFTVIVMLISDIANRREAAPRRGLARIVPYALLLCAYPLWILITPNAWGDPLGYSLGVVGTFLDFVNWWGSALFAGRLVAYNEVPRTYFLTWIGITVPLAYLALALLGTGAFCRESVQKNGPRSLAAAPAGRTVLTMMLMLLFIVLGYQFVTKPVVYNGWRHAYFLYPVMVAFAVYGLAFLRRVCQGGWKRALRLGGICALGASMLFTLNTMVREHPYEFASYNILGKRVALEFDRDYWKVSNLAALRELLAQEEGTLKIACLDGEYEPFMFGHQMLTQEELARLSWGHPLEECDYLLANCRFLVDTNDMPSARDGFTEIGAIWCGDVKLTSIQKRLSR